MPPIRDNPIRVAEGLRLMRAFQRIHDAQSRAAIILIAERLARRERLLMPRPRRLVRRRQPQ
jgi:hypothetical protein